MHIFKSLLKIKWTAIVFLFFGLVIFAWLTSIALAPIYKLKQIQNFINADSVFAENFDSINFHQDMKNLVKEKSYKEALLALSENDSIQLIISMPDSSINLSIKGVIIHHTKFSTFNINKLFNKLTLIQEIKLFSQPLLLHHQYATIVKEPVVVRHAPKDTVEAALNAYEPDTLFQNPAFVAFTFEHNIRIVLEQDASNSKEDKIQKGKFYNNLIIREIKLSTYHFFHFKKQDYCPEIVIKMPVNDLRAIYRALPNNTYAVIKL